MGDDLCANLQDNFLIIKRDVKMKCLTIIITVGQDHSQPTNRTFAVGGSPVGALPSLTLQYFNKAFVLINRHIFSFLFSQA